MPTIRKMTPADLAAATELCRLAGWNQLREDWQRMLAVCPQGLFVAQDEGVVCGSASAVSYGQASGWIGMVLVHPQFRRRGIATLLMNACIEHLQGLGVRSIKLDATDQGRPVYQKLGFLDERVILRLARPTSAAAQANSCVSVADADWPAITAMDAVAFGADRTDLLKNLQATGMSAVARDGDGAIIAYGFARAGFEAAMLGPVVASDAQAAREVTLCLLSQLSPGKVYWDMLPDNVEAQAIAEELGFAPARELMRMYLGDEPCRGEVGRVFAAAGFEWG